MQLDHASTLRALNARLAHKAFERGDGAAVHRPIQLFLQIASGCNLDCYMCSEHNRPPETRHGRDLQSFAPYLFDKLAEQAFPFAEGVTIGVGGEPTLSPHFESFIRRAHAAGLRVELMTNGTRLTTEAIARTIAECVTRVQISIDGATKDTYERIRRGSSWSHMRSGLQRLDEYRKTLGAGRSTQVTFCFVLMRSNVHELPAFVAFAREFGADSVHAQHCIPVTEDSRDEPLIDDPERYEHFRELALRTAASLDMPLDLPAPFPRASGPASAVGEPAAPLPSEDRRPIACSMPTLDLYVLFDGRVFPCCHPFAHKKMMLGDLRTQSFEEIWNGRTARNLRIGLRSGEVPSICRNCSLIHDPPPAFEDPKAIESMPDLADWYGDRDLDPLQHRAETLNELGAIVEEHLEVAATLRAEIAGQRAHIANLEPDRAGLRAHCNNLEVELTSLRSHAHNLESLIAGMPLPERV